MQTAVSDTSSSFVGVAFGTDGDLAWWRADVERTPLDPQPAFVTGGTFELDGHLRDIVGAFSNGGLIIRESTSSCRRETFAVAGFLDLDGGEGFYDMTLTHYRLRIGAQCITYFATVEGLVAFALT